MPLARFGNNESAALKIAHISDLHLSSLENVRREELMNKRILGYLSWKLNRRHLHSGEVLSRTLDDLATRQPEHLIISGDFTQLGTAGECVETRAWLDGAGRPDYISIVPGNHDCYARDDFDQTIGRWTPYMEGDPDETGGNGSAAGAGADAPPTVFPYLRVRASTAIIGLSTARPTAPFLATGKLGNEQLRRLDELLERLADRGLYRIVVMHHSPQPDREGYRRCLVDAKALLSVLDKAGVEMILHGHGHRQVCQFLRTGRNRVPVFGVPSASACDDDPKKKAGYNTYEINKTPDGWLTHIESFVFDAQEQAFSRNFSYVLKS